MSAISKYILDLLEKDTIKNVITLMTGSAIAQGIAIISAPIITRLYSADQFGIYGLFLSAVSILAISVCLCYELAIVLPDNELEAKNLFFGSIIIVGIMCIIVLLILIAFGSSFGNMLSVDKYESYIYLIPLSLFFAGVYQALTYWYARRKEYKILSLSRISKSFVTAAGQIGSKGVLPNIGTGGLINGLILGQIISVIVLMKKFRCKMPREGLFDHVNTVNILSVLGRYKKFPLVSSWSSILNIFSMHMPIFFITYFFGISTAGFYELTNRVLMAPSLLIGSAVTQVFFQEGSMYFNEKGNIAHMVELIATRLLQLIVIPLITISLFGPALFSFIFGDEWRMAGNFAQILAPSFGIQFIILPISMVLLILELQHIVALWKILYILSLSTILVWSSNYFDIVGVMVCYSVGNVVLFSLYGYLIFKHSGASFYSSVRGIFRFKIL